MTQTMQALVFDRTRGPWESTRGLWKQEVPAPVLAEGADWRDGYAAIIQPKYAGFCGSDRGIWLRTAHRDMVAAALDRERKDVLICGHELYGEIVEIGSQATRELGLKAGDTVSTESHIICGTCYQCRIGDNHVCADNLILGISTDGCFAERVKLPARALWPTDTRRMRPEVAALQEPFGNAVHACTKVSLRGKRVAVIGCGTIGLLAVAIARALGASLVIGVEPMPSHIEMAKKIGASAVLVPANTEGTVYGHDPDLARRIRAMTDGVGVDVALEMTGVNASVNNAIASVRRGGDVILFGFRSGNAVIEDLERVIVDGISLHSVIGRRVWETWHIARNLLESRDSTMQDLIWNVILRRGDGTIVDFARFERDEFEARISEHPKVLLRFG